MRRAANRLNSINISHNTFLALLVPSIPIEEQRIGNPTREKNYSSEMRAEEIIRILRDWMWAMSGGKVVFPFICWWLWVRGIVAHKLLLFIRRILACAEDLPWDLSGWPDGDFTCSNHKVFTFVQTKSFRKLTLSCPYAWLPLGNGMHAKAPLIDEIRILAMWALSWRRAIIVMNNKLKFTLAQRRGGFVWRKRKLAPPTLQSRRQPQVDGKGRAFVPRCEQRSALNDVVDVYSSIAKQSERSKLNIE